VLLLLLLLLLLLPAATTLAMGSAWQWLRQGFAA
jgi:hypothetical protein